MRKTKVALILLTVVSVAMTVSCDRSDKHSEDEILFSYLTAERSYRLDGSATDYGEDRDLCFGSSARLILPQILRGHDATDLRDSILTLAFGRCAGNTDTLIVNSLAERAAEIGYAVSDTVLPDSVIAATPNFLSRYDGFYSVVSDVETLTGNILSYGVKYSTYIPHAAHGMYGVSYVNYDIDSMRVISLESLFTPEGIDALPEIIRQTATDMVSVIGKTEIAGLPANGNFCISSDNKIVFTYQPYEVASYAQGVIEIPLPAYILANYLTEYGTQLLLQ